jgi:hypothetical protein
MAFSGTFLLRLFIWVAALQSALAFDPADHGNVVLHLDASALNQPGGTAVDEWGPLSASGAAMPTLVGADARFGGRPVVVFDGNDVMKAAAVDLAARTIFAVACLESDAVDLAGLISNGSDRLNLRRNGASLFYRAPGQGMDSNDFVGNGSPTGTLDVNQVASGAFVPGQAHLLLAVAGGQKIYQDFWLGSASSGLGRHWKGAVAEVLVYDGTLAPEDIDRVGWYLQEKYALPTDYPNPAPVVTLTLESEGLLSTAGVLSSAGAPVTLAWAVEGADTVAIDPGILPAGGTLQGQTVVAPAATTTYTLTASGSGGVTEREVTIHIGAAAQHPHLNEIVASNSGGLRDEDGDSPDWIELHNPNPFAIDLGGYQVQDSANLWAIPPGSAIEADGYRILFASSKDRAIAGAELHTNFALSAGGEALQLLDQNLQLIDAYAPYPPLRTNLSYGRSGGGTAFFAVPTPGAANAAGSTGWVAEVGFSVARGFHDSAFALALDCATPGAVIRFTTDGSTPTESNGTIYSSPVQVAETTTFRAAAFAAGQIPSVVSTHSYLFTADVIANQVYPAGTPPPGWPASGVNGQVMRYGWNSTLKAQYTTLQLDEGLRQIPTLSIVTDQANLTQPATGIYVNASMKGDTWERPVSLEYLDAAGTTYHIDCGLRIRGGASRGDGYPKHSLRLHFRGKYGAGTMSFPIHGEDGATEFDTLDLRTEQNYHWANSTGTENTAVREVFCRDIAAAMGQPTTRSTYVHVYLNGHYWGLYQTEERAQEDYGASYFGGLPQDYDVIQTSNHPNFTYELSSGSLDAWQALWNLARAHQANPTPANYFALSGRNAAGDRMPGMPVYLEPDHLISYTLLHYYTGDGDGPLSNFLGMNRANNWRGLRSRVGAEGFHFFVHDAEHTLQAPNWVDNRANTNAPNGSNRGNFTYSNPEWIHEDLTGNPEYRLRFADLAWRHLFHGGALTPAAAQAVFDARAAQISQAIVPDVSRWGQSATAHTAAQWNARLNAIRSGFFTGRTSMLISQLRSRGLYPSVAPPAFSQRGGQVDDGYLLVMNAGGQSGTIHFTLDGSDPRAIGGGVAGSTYTGPIPIHGLVKVRARFRSNTQVWSALEEAEFVALPAAAAGDLVISKIHYHPADPSAAEIAAGFSSASDFEYIELMNIGTGTLDLSGVSLTLGVSFSFAAADLRVLSPGGRVVIAGNAAALQFRHGPGLPVAGTYAGDLSNGGEALRLAGVADVTLVELLYDDQPPWPRSPDGEGFALVLRDPGANPDPSLAASWRASHAIGGRPGAADALDPATWRALHFSAADLADPALEPTLWGDAADPDADGLPNLIEMATGSLPGDPASRAMPTASWWTDPSDGERYLVLTCRLHVDLSGVTVAAEASGDLLSWEGPLPAVSEPSPAGGDFVEITFRDVEAVADAPGAARYLRLKVLAD